MAGNLKARLSRLKSLGLERASEMQSHPTRSSKGETPGAGPSDGEESREPPAFLDGWDKRAEFLWSREIRFDDPLPDSVDLAPFLATFGRRSGGRVRPGQEARPDPERERLADSRCLRFFDLETTGLSGGTGTIAFLAGIGLRDPEGFIVRQLFLSDFPGEPDFIATLLCELPEEAALVSYNGRAFDFPLLRSRCVMCGMAPPERSHVDALYASRRLWRRIHGGASLGLLEREVLGLERDLDVPGSLIPEIYFEFLKRGDHPQMRAVLSHNAEDVANLARLFSRAARAFESPRSHAADLGIDRRGLGRTMLVLGRSEEGEELLEAAAADGDLAAAFFLSRRYRRSGRIADARSMLDMMVESHETAVERSRLAERGEGDLASALEFAEIARNMAGEGKEREEAGKRVARLIKRIARQRKS